MSSEAFEQQREDLRGLYEIKARTALRDVAMEGEFFLFDQVIVCEYGFSPMVFDHDPARLRGYDNDYILVESYLTGTGQAHVGDRLTQLSSEIIHFKDWSRRTMCITEHVTGRSLMVPHHVVGYDPSIHPAEWSVASPSTKGQMLNDLIRSFFVQAQAGQDAYTQMCRDLCVSFVRQVLVETSENPLLHMSNNAQRLAIKGYIDRNIANLSLTPAKLCHDLQLSRATLYRLFEEDGGVVRFIDNLRLAKCFDALQVADARRGEIKRVAERWGYTDSTGFNRKFRRQFGMAPSDCLAMRRTEIANRRLSDATVPINRWLQTNT